MNSNKNSLYYLFLIPILFLVSFSEKEFITENLVNGTAETPLVVGTIDPIQSLEELNHFISRSIRYPITSRTAGETGQVVLFAKVDASGNIMSVSTEQPEDGFVELKKISIIGYSAKDQPKPEKIHSSNHENLVEEAKRVVSSFPELDVPELVDQTVRFQFDFDLR